MNSTALKLVSLFFLSVHGGSVFATEVFVRPMISRIVPSGAGYSNATALGAAAGVFLGRQSRHEVSLEVVDAEWDVHQRAGFLSLDGDETFRPILLNYRFHTSAPSGLKNIRAYVGPTAGLAQNKISFTFQGSGVRRTDHDSDWNFAYGGAAGFVIKLAPRIDLDLGYRYLKLENPDYTAAGLGLKGENSHVQMVSAGVGFSF